MTLQDIWIRERASSASPFYCVAYIRPPSSHLRLSSRLRARWNESSSILWNEKKIYVGSPRISRSFNFVENIYMYITYLEWRFALVFPSNLIEQREQIRSGIKKFRLMGDDRRLSRDDVRVVAYTRHVAYQPTCRACKSNGLWSNNSALCTATRHQAKANTRFTARLYFRKLPFPPTTFPLPSFESNEKITLNTSRKSFSQCLLKRAKYLTD